ncbi:MAG: hypothetical protein ACNS62_00860 [Candidatus Cyclobacteriaceae bacterium M3_2C_046]
MEDSAAIDALIIKYKTIELPAPYAYKFNLKVRFGTKGMDTEFQLTYIQRGDLSEEEILEEGFTLEDDFSWKGILEQVWQEELQKLLEKTRLTGKKSGPADINLRLLYPEQPAQTGQPDQLENWEYLLQELMQAIFETSQKEAPLVLRFKKIDPDHQPVQLNLFFLFKNRKVKAKNEKNGKTMEINWSVSKNLLRNLFIPDYDFNQPPIKPKDPGFYIDPGEGIWYKSGQTVTNPSKFDVLAQIQEEVENFWNNLSS